MNRGLVQSTFRNSFMFYVFMMFRSLILHNTGLLPLNSVLQPCQKRLKSVQAFVLVFVLWSLENKSTEQYDV